MVFNYLFSRLTDSLFNVSVDSFVTMYTETHTTSPWVPIMTQEERKLLGSRFYDWMIYMFVSTVLCVLLYLVHVFIIVGQ